LSADDSPGSGAAIAVDASDGLILEARHWQAGADAKAVVQLVHGASEHIGRYQRLAQRLNRAGYHVIGADHRGHGANAIHGVGNFGARGFSGLVDDMVEITLTAGRRYPGLPLVMFAHSMGSFAAQLYLANHASLIDGLILSGTAAIDQVLADADLAAGMYALNAAFEPARTPFDWLSRDADEVDAYIADPRCGHEIGLESMMTMGPAVSGVRLPDRMISASERQVPVLIITGECDPIVGPGQVSARTVEQDYRKAGLRDVTHLVYPGARHELINETNREEVLSDLLAWLDHKFGG
jgi:alpha-beta hydrolase superfamily lysophospholipase